MSFLCLQIDQKTNKIFVCFLVNLKTQKGHFEINWPLSCFQKVWKILLFVFFSKYMNFSVKLQNVIDISIVPFNIPGNVHFSFSFTSSMLVRRFPCKLVYFWIAFWNLLLNDGLLPSVSNFVIANGFFFFSKMMRKRKGMYCQFIIFCLKVTLNT